MAKYVSQENLTQYDSLIKTHIDEVHSHLKTINNQSLVGEGNITIDLTLYKVVTTLPTEDIDTNKIYLVLSTESEEANVYTEYVYVNNAWEKK